MKLIQDIGDGLSENFWNRSGPLGLFETVLMASQISWTFWNDSGGFFGFSGTVLADFLDFLKRF
uniref:Uncharacterized protein n=1 Tax=Rhizophagus irregularis (strain DAOM 181602 / DAOM 197198 / MUCL 43194) TaxID=747089 RepID=U9SRX8_RHIID